MNFLIKFSGIKFLIKIRKRIPRHSHDDISFEAWSRCSLLMYVRAVSEWEGEKKPKDYVHDELFLFFFPLHVKRASEWGGGGWGMFLYVSNNFLLFNHRYGACLLSIYSSCIILYSRKVKMVRGMGSLQGKSSTKGAKFILIDAAVVWKMYELFSCVQ